jgi:putative transposase
MVHKTANVLDKLPRGSQPKAKRMLHDISQAEGRAQAEKAFDRVGCGKSSWQSLGGS